MPHLILDLPGGVGDLALRDAEWVVREPQEDVTCKVLGMFSDAARTSILFRVLVVEGRLRQGTYLGLYPLRDRPGAWILGLDRHTETIRTAGVKKMIALVGVRLMAQCPGASRVGGNLDAWWEWAQNIPGDGV